MKDETRLKLESHQFDLMWELVLDILLKISGKLFLSENFEKIFSPYILCRYLSMNTRLIDYAIYLNSVNSNSNLSKEQFYKLAYSIIPKQQNSYIKYIKKIKKEDTKNKNDDTNNLKNIELNNNLFEI
jgi:hypothetical protein